MGGDDQRNAARLMKDRWFRFHEIAMDKDDSTYQLIVQLRHAYRPYTMGKGDVIDPSEGDSSLSGGTHADSSTPQDGNYTRL